MADDSRTSPHPTSPPTAQAAVSEGRGKLTLASAMQHVPGVGNRRASLFQRLGIHRLADLLKHLPYRYEHHAGHMPVAELPLETIATAQGVVQTCRFIPARSSPIGRARGGRGRFTATLADGTGTLDLVWFNGSFLRDRIHPGITLTVTGQIRLYDGNRQIANPKFQITPTPGPPPPFPMTRLCPATLRTTAG